MKNKTTETKPLIEIPPSWHCRMKIGSTSEKTGKRIVTAELVFGHESEPDKHGHTTVSGSVHFKINGSTAELSVTEMAEKLNAEGRIPRDEIDECFADKAGWEAASRRNPQAVAIPLPVEQNPTLPAVA